MSDVIAGGGHLPRSGISRHKVAMTWPFEIHKTYSRKANIHVPYGGQQQGGICTPAKAPGIFIFTGHGAGIIGYKDRYEPDGTLRYTGQGQIGDMQMVSGNKAIRDHAKDGKDLLVFTQLVKGGGIRFEGLFTCAGWETERQTGIDDVERNAIVFSLTPLRQLEFESDDLDSTNVPAVDLSDLRQRALAAGSSAPARTIGKPSTIYERSRDVREYVLARAKGHCEACLDPAPFTTANGRPFLEAHHIRRLTDGGPDDIRYVAAICPNCHRRAHHGQDRGTFNAALAAKVSTLEASI